MAEPTSILTFAKLLTRVAKEADMAYYGASGQERAMPPIDVHDLEICKDLVNDSIREFIADAPETGWRWKRRIMSVTLTGTRITGTADSATDTTLVDATLMDTYGTEDELVDYYIYITGGEGIGSWAVITGYDETIGECFVDAWLDEYGNVNGASPEADSTFAITPVETVGGDIARYPLPEYFSGEITGPIQYQKDSAHSRLIEWRDESFIRARRAVSVVTGYPNYAAIRPLEPRTNALDPKRRKELIVDPQPSSSEVVEFPYEIIFNNLDMETGVADSGSSTIIVDATRTEGDDWFNGWYIEIISGTGLGSHAIVTDYYSGTFEVAEWIKANGAGGGTAPDVDSIYMVEPANNLHPAGARFDQVILSACLMQAEIQFEDINVGYVDKYIKKDLPQAYKIDARSAPRKLGSMNRGINVRYRHWADVTTDHDI